MDKKGRPPWNIRGNSRSLRRGSSRSNGSIGSVSIPNDHLGKGETAGPSGQIGRGNNHKGIRNQNEDRPRPYGRQLPENYQMGFKILEDLTKKDTEALVSDLQNSREGYMDLLNSKLANDSIVLVVKVLRRICDTNFVEVKRTLLQKSFVTSFEETLRSYICTLPSQRILEQRNNSQFWRDPNEFWTNLLKICDDMFNLLPTFACVHLDGILDALKIYVPIFEAQHNQHVSDEIKNEIAKQLKIVEEKRNELGEKRKEEVQRKMNYEQEEPPPNDFRGISVYPRPNEVGGGQGYLRCNVVEGPYTDVYHYLDVQFRLLREDFVAPLRDGISEYRSGSKKRIEEVRIHKRVRFLCSETVNEKFCRRIKFAWNVKKKSKDENSKKFMFGSLLCFTCDQFKTLIFGKVAGREDSDLERGELIVGFDQDVPVLFNVDYLMVECSVYFEPYYHVLNVLKSMSPENFPMERYIINVSSEVHPPEYLQPLCKYNIEGHVFSPLNEWSEDLNFYRFNDSQRAAFKAAMTQEFAIIQGPPGTGKTFLGLKIAKTLLENKDCWYDSTPMLVICYTNHALDQFLEGITAFTQKIIRVGGRSQNLKLTRFNLRRKVRYMNSTVREQRDEVQNILEKIDLVTDNLRQISFYDSIIDFNIFGDCVKNFKNSWFATATKQEILDWLLEEAFADHPELVEVLNEFNRILIDGESYEETENDLPEKDEEYNENNVDERQQNPIDEIFEEVVNDLGDVKCSSPLQTLDLIYEEMIRENNRLMRLNELLESPITFENFVKIENQRLKLQRLDIGYNFLQEKLFWGRQRQHVPKTMPQNANLKNPKKMKYEDRWHLYFYWLDRYKALLERKYTQLNEEFRERFQICEDLKDVEDTEAMKKALVVGMTTTSAARLRSTLEALKSPIVIVEEAAEVLESHVVASLTRHCKHLILIGDHQQLKPSTASYKVEIIFKLGISLFERMVMNKIQCYTLNVQHRMRPEISCLITPTIYPNLEDHESVLGRPNIRGVEKSVFFLDHKHKEDNCEGTSKKNRHEVDFLINFARHLILNGYEAKNITILAAYLGQMFEMQKARNGDRTLFGLRISVLDNYQGEESDIILLSLVRSNKEGKIGFLSVENRVCVALSRARDGFYIMGNMTQFTNKSELWRQIKTTLENQGSLGTELSLRCQIHADKLTRVKSAQDFYKIPKGGCDQKCDAALVCGHNCASPCHVSDRDHKRYKCREVCGKKFCDKNELHTCKKMCYEYCGPCTYLVPATLKCGHDQNIFCHENPDTHLCLVPVACILPCGHEVANKPCHKDPEAFICPHPCKSTIKRCGHVCRLTCHVREDPNHLRYLCTNPCGRYRKGCTVQTEEHMCQKKCLQKCGPCLILVEKRRIFCPHVYEVPCHVDVDELVCEKTCPKVLPCGHKCMAKCFETCRDKKCPVEMEKINDVCKHSIKVKCFQEPDRKLCKKKCPLQLPCGHPCTKKCNEPCTPVCRVVVDCLLHSPCGHVVTKVECGVKDTAKSNPELLFKFCNAPCQETLKCAHKCSGNCGACSQGRVHQRCQEKCGVPLVCNHECNFPCRTPCGPCSLPCTYGCKHRQCRKKCGDACTLCKKDCPRRCPHQKCPKYCGEICDIPPCSEPCPKLLICGHPCIGFCGDPCPPKCLTCDKEELLQTSIFFEGEKEDRFVLLEDCGHVFENSVVEYWLKESDEETSVKKCPKCRAPIKKTERYSHLVKQARADAVAVKVKFHGIAAENEKQRKELELKVNRLRSKVASFVFFPSLRKATENMFKRLKISKSSKRQNKYELRPTASKLQIVERIVAIICDNKKNSSPVVTKQVKFIMSVLLRDDEHITDQETEDISNEINRLIRIMEFCQVLEKVGGNFHNTTGEGLQTKIELILFKYSKYDDADDAKLKELLTKLSTISRSQTGIVEKEKREILQ